MSDENKQFNKVEEVGNKPTILSISDTTVFKDNPHLVYLYKKTEKLVSALYLLSSFISDKEPIKWQMREAGVDLLSNSLALSDRSSSERMLAYAKFISTGLKFLSFLEVSYHGGIISEMNYSILKYEFENLIQTAESGEKIGDAKGLIFADHFFEVPKTISGHQPVSNVSNNHFSTTIANKGQNDLSDKMSVSKMKKPARLGIPGGVKSNRQDIIISLLKKNPELGIKDFISSIKDCSEKTIQRELVLLVSKGQIKKAGEKRWSRYSLK